MKFAISVTRSGLRGLTNAYKSVLSASGSALIIGASRWLEPTRDGTEAAAATPITNRKRITGFFTFTSRIPTALSRKRMCGVCNPVQRPDRRNERMKK